LGGIDVAGLIGLRKGMGGDKSDEELIREAWDEIAAKCADFDRPPRGRLTPAGALQRLKDEQAQEHQQP
jgi:hypothetical protein